MAKKKEDPMKQMLGGLLLIKSLVLMEYKNSTDILLAKYVLSKVSPEVYHFCKYCMSNPENIRIDEDAELNYHEFGYIYQIMHGNMGFEFSSRCDTVQFMANSSWQEFSTSEYDKALLSSVYKCLNEREHNDMKLKKIQENADARLKYISMYKEAT